MKFGSILSLFLTFLSFYSRSQSPRDQDLIEKYKKIFSDDYFVERNETINAAHFKQSPYTKKFPHADLQNATVMFFASHKFVGKNTRLKLIHDEKATHNIRDGRLFVAHSLRSLNDIVRLT